HIIQEYLLLTFEKRYVPVIYHRRVGTSSGPVCVEQAPADSRRELRIAQDGVKEGLVRRERILEIFRNVGVTLTKRQQIMACISSQSPGTTRIRFQIPEVFPIITLSEAELCQCSYRESTHGLVRLKPQRFDPGDRLAGRGH